MEKIIIIDLTNQEILEQEYVISSDSHYGRGLALQLLKEHATPDSKRLDEGNALVFVPGILTGNKVPCATRGILMTKGEGEQGLLVSNFTGDLPQKLASLQIAAIVIKGKSKQKNMGIYLDSDTVKFMDLQELNSVDIPNMVEWIRTELGQECAVWGVGKAADMLLPTATYFTTYPEGTPRFSCPRNSFGDVAGSKGIRAIIVKESHYFNGNGVCKSGMQEKGKKLAQMIVKDQICGGALPGLGSITLLHLLKSKKELPKVEKSNTAVVMQRKATEKINTCCAPMCVIGCLNRHSAHSGEVYGSPAESEVRAALMHRFGEMPVEFAKELNERGFAIGLDAVEFVNTAAIYLQAMHIVPTEEELWKLFDEIEKGTLLGRVLGGGTKAISALYKEKEELQGMVTKPAVVKENQVHVRLEHFSEDMQGTNDLELLYQQVFILENLGICIFSAFAILNNREALELLAEIVSDKVGEQISLKHLLQDAKHCIEEEQSFLHVNACQSVQKSIPEFIKVLYSYFEM